MANPRVRVAIAFARNFAAGLVQNAEIGFQQHLTNFSEEEMEVANAEMARIYERLQKTVNEDDLEKSGPPLDQDDD